MSTDPCVIQSEWRVDPMMAMLAGRLIGLASPALGRAVRIISGFRTVEHQLRLRRQGRPAADPDISNHTVCPARAVDISIGFAPTATQKAILGRIATEVGLRWGGGSVVDPRTGIPSDWNHFDLGPRPQ